MRWICRAAAAPAGAAAAAAAAGGKRHTPRPGAPGGGRAHRRTAPRLLQAPDQAARLRIEADRDTGAARAGGEPGTAFGLQQVRERLTTLYGTSATLELIAPQRRGTSACRHFSFKNQSNHDGHAP